MTKTQILLLIVAAMIGVLFIVVFTGYLLFVKDVNSVDTSKDVVDRNCFDNAHKKALQIDTNSLFIMKIADLPIRLPASFMTENKLTSDSKIECRSDELSDRDNAVIDTYIKMNNADDYEIEIVKGEYKSEPKYLLSKAESKIIDEKLKEDKKRVERFLEGKQTIDKMIIPLGNKDSSARSYINPTYSQFGTIVYILSTRQFITKEGEKFYVLIKHFDRKDNTSANKYLQTLLTTYNDCILEDESNSRGDLHCGMNKPLDFFNDLNTPAFISKVESDYQDTIHIQTEFLRGIEVIR